MRGKEHLILGRIEARLQSLATKKDVHLLEATIQRSYDRIEKALKIACVVSWLVCGVTLLAFSIFMV